MGFISRDVRQASRSLLRSPGFAAVAVLTLGIGIGATTTIYSLLERVVLEPLPYPHAERLVQLTSETSEGTWHLSRAQYSLFMEEAETLDRLAGFNFSQTIVGHEDGAERVGLWRGTASLFELLGARAALGRLINEADDEFRAPEVVVLSHGYWQRQFGGDRDVVGQTLMVNEQPLEIVGVMQPGLELPEHVPATVRPEIWLPLQLNLADQFWNSHMEFRTLARLAEGATAESATRELQGFNPRLIDLFPDAYDPAFMEKYSFTPTATPLKQALVGEVAGNLWILMAGVALVLLIACANVANLFLVRADRRRREMALRVSLGAGRASILRSFLSESAVLGAAGALLGVVLATGGVAWFVRAAPADLPRLAAAGLNVSVLGFATALGVLIALSLSLLTGIRYLTGGERVAELAEGTRSTAGRDRQRARGVLVVTQVALAMILLVAATLLVESFRRMQAIEPGVEPDGVVVVNISLPAARYDTRAEVWAYQRALLAQVRAVPGVAEAGVGQQVPFSGGYGCTVQAFDDPVVAQRIRDANGTLCAAQLSVGDGYFSSLGIPVLQGRALGSRDNDHPDAGSAVVSQAFVDKFWPGEQEVIGRRVAPSGRSQGPFYTVVGVVGDVYGASPTEEPAPAIYYPVVPIPPTGGLWGSATDLVVRTDMAEPMSLFPRLRAAAEAVDPAVPLSNPQTMASMVAASMSELSFTMTLLGTAALTALLLAAIGLYGVVSYLVQRRTGEIGVRVAMGAAPGRVQRLVVGGALRFAVAGLLVGVVAAAALSRFLSSLLYQVEPSEPVAYAAAALLITAVAAVASWIPARRAAGLDPVEALRAE